MVITNIREKMRVANLKWSLVLVLLLAATSAKALFSGGDGSSAAPYLIGSAADLNNIRNYRGATNAFLYYRQTTNIDLLAYTSNWQPIGNLTSPQPVCIHYDGGNFRISNLNISRSSESNPVGLFSYFMGSVRNLTLDSGDVAGSNNVGALVGRLDYGSVSNCQSKVRVSGASTVGGLVGYNLGGTLKYVSARTNSVSGTVYVGGLVGINSGGSLAYSFAAVPVVCASTNAGGLVGLAGGTGPSVNACYWDTNISGRVTSAGGTGLSTAAMQQRSSFTNWDFNTVWQLYTGKSYPYLRAQADNVAIPVLTPGSGAFPGTTVTVTATGATAGATLHYTIGRTDPTDTNAVTSTGSIAVPIGETLKVVAWKAYMNPSAVSAATYTPAPLADTPTVDQPAGQYPGTNLVVVLSSTTTNATIRYTTNGDDPTETNAWVLSGGAVNVPIPSVLKAKAYRSDLNPSPLLQAVYTNAAPVATPVFSPNGGAFAGTNVSVTITCATPGAMIRYTTDGNDPTIYSAGGVSNVVVIVPLPATLKAQAFHDDLNPSAIRSAAYSNAAPVATPVFSPNGGTFAGSSVSVTVTCATAGAIIRYTTDGIDPTEGSTGLANGAAVSVPIPRTLKARAYKSGLNPSVIQAALYENAADTATPTFNPDAGEIAAGNVKVTVSSTTPGAIIRYTTDGSDPTETSASGSSGMVVTIPVPGSLKAKAWADGLNPSSIKTAGYTTAGVVEAPTFSPDGGAGAMTVTLSCVTSGALIHYTTNGEEPTQASPSVASTTSVPVPSPSTLKAKAFKNGLFPSPVKVAYYGDFAGGSGTAQDPYRIANALHLDKVRNYLGAHFMMVGDIDLGVSPWNSGAGWLPIDDGGDGFVGTFDGGGHVVSNLYISRSTSEYIGLFGYVGAGGRIGNLGVASGTVAGKSYVGGLAGACYGTVSNSFAAASVSATTLYAGGLVGVAGPGSLSFNVHALGDVANGGGISGGLIGFANGTSVLNSYAIGLVTALNTKGGLIGQVAGTLSCSSSYWDKQTSTLSSSAGGEGKFTAEMKQQITFDGWDFDSIWRIDPGVDYPRLRVFDSAKPTSSVPPDQWLIRFYGAVAAAPDASVRDWPLYWEYVAGTDPTDPTSVFAVSGTDGSNSNLTLQVNSVTGRVYRLLSTPSLTAPNWQPVGVASNGTGGPLTFDTPAPVTRTFYRISVELE